MPISKTGKSISGKNPKPRLSRRRRGGFLPFPQTEIEQKAVAVSFETYEDAQEAARVIQMLLNDKWSFRQVASTAHADNGVIVFSRELPNQPERKVKYGR